MNNVSLDLPSGYAFLTPITGDASARSYARLQGRKHSAILMDCRNERGDRPGMSEYVSVTKLLASHNIRVPEIYHVDTDQKFLIIEDFGDTSMRTALDHADNPMLLYSAAADTLNQMHRIPDGHNFPSFHGSFIDEKHADVIWVFYPVFASHAARDIHVLVSRYRGIWDEIQSRLPPCPSGLLHMDFHVENLMVLPPKNGAVQLGVIDFQDAMIGPAAYDWTHLLRDVRMDVDADIREYFLSRMEGGMRSWFDIYTMQWHCRVLGLFVHFYQTGKHKYIVHLPRMIAYVRDVLKRDDMRLLRDFFKDIGLDFSALSALTVDEIIAIVKASEPT